MINKKIVICTTIKNEAKNLNSYFRLLDKIINIFEDYFLIFIESESRDKTSVMVEKYLKNKKGKIINKELDTSLNRIVKLEICRNEYLDYVKNSNVLKGFDYLIVMDADGVNNKLNTKNLKNSLLNNINWNAIFANQSLFYYDIFALRIDNFISKNFVTRIKEDLKVKKFKNFKDCVHENLTKFFYLNRIFKERFIKVNSAFGGFAIYKLNKIIEFKYESNFGVNCEHVKLNEDLNLKYGNLYIDKNLINSSGINKHTINGYLSSISNFFAKRFIQKIL